MRSFALLRQQPLRVTRTATLPATRTFTSATRLNLKEGGHHTGEELEQAKQQQKHSSKAREELKSQSESSVSADREQVKDHDKHMKELQQETAKASEAEKGKR